jgi:osmotically-inducible protein OsmY
MATRREYERYPQQAAGQRDGRYPQNYRGQGGEQGNYGYRDWDWNEEGRTGEYGRSGQGRRGQGGREREDEYEGGRGGYQQSYRGGRENDWPERGRFGNEYDSDQGDGNGYREQGYRGGYRSGNGGRGSSRYGDYSGYGGYGGYGSEIDISTGRGNTGYSATAQGSYGGREYGGSQDQGQDQGRFRGIGPKGYSRSDERLKEDISDRLMDDPEIDASQIEIEVDDGEVTLSGTVESRNIKFEVERMADTISGVKDVHNQLRVQRQDSRESGSEDNGEGSQGRRSGQTSAPQSSSAGKSSRSAGSL